MTVTNYKLDIISFEKEIFSDLVKRIQITGIEGDLGIYPNHSPFITLIRPGMVRIVTLQDNEEYIYISGGILEVQFNTVIILADVGILGKDLNKKKVIESKRKIIENISKSSNIKNNYNQLYIELSKEIAKLKVIELTKKIFSK